MRFSRLAGLCLLLLLPCAARADDIGPAQAQALQQQLKDWLAGLLGPAVTLPDLPWRITGEHDHYAIAWPIPGLASPAGEAAMTANVRPLDGGRWSIDEVTIPPSGTLTIALPEAGEAGKSVPVDMQFSVGRQDTHGTIDPGLATASTMHTDIGDMVIASNSAKQRQEQRINRYRADTSLTPTPGRPARPNHERLGRWLEVRLADQQRHAGGDRHREHARGRARQRREPRPRRWAARCDRRPDRRAAPWYSEQERPLPLPPGRSCAC